MTKTFAVKIMKSYVALILLNAAFAFSSCNKTDTPSVNSGSDAPEKQPSASKHEELAAKIMDSMKAFATAVSSVSDVETAKSAAEEIDKIGDRVAEIVAQLKPLDPPSEDFRASIHEKMEASYAEMRKAGKGKEIPSYSPESKQLLEKASWKWVGRWIEAEKEFARHFPPFSDFEAEKKAGMARRARQDISLLTTALRMYEKDNLVLPDQLQDLVTRPSGDVKRWRQVLKAPLKDPWGNEYEYRNPGQHIPTSFDLFSAGPNRVPGDDDDIGNWE